MGTMESALLLEHSVETERTVNTLAAALSKTGERSASANRIGLTWRSGDDVSEGGHMMFSSIGQAIWSSTKRGAS